MENIGIEATDTRDAFGRYRFLPFNPENEVVPQNQSDPYWNCMYYPEHMVGTFGIYGWMETGNKIRLFLAE